MKLKKFKIGYIEKSPTFFDKLKNEFSEQTLSRKWIVLFR
jgi:DNA primase